MEVKTGKKDVNQETLDLEAAWLKSHEIHKDLKKKIEATGALNNREQRWERWERQHNPIFKEYYDLRNSQCCGCFCTKIAWVENCPAAGNYHQLWRAQTENKSVYEFALKLCCIYADVQYPPPDWGCSLCEGDCRESCEKAEEPEILALDVAEAHETSDLLKWASHILKDNFPHDAKEQEAIKNTAELEKTSIRKEMIYRLMTSNGTPITAKQDYAEYPEDANDAKDAKRSRVLQNNGKKKTKEPEYIFFSQDHGQHEMKDGNRQADLDLFLEQLQKEFDVMDWACNKLQQLLETPAPDPKENEATLDYASEGEQTPLLKGVQTPLLKQWKNLSCVSSTVDGSKGKCCGLEHTFNPPCGFLKWKNEPQLTQKDPEPQKQEVTQSQSKEPQVQEKIELSEVGKKMLEMMKERVKTYPVSVTPPSCLFPNTANMRHVVCTNVEFDEKLHDELGRMQNEETR